MTISEIQLGIWASAPSPTEMQKIQNTRNVIEDILRRRLPVDEIKRKYNLSKFDFEIYLQGSYANSTNVRFDSDVDIVVQLNQSFFPNKDSLSAEEKVLYEKSHSDALYKFPQFKQDIYDALNNELGTNQVHWKDKCINIDGNTYRVVADVVPCLQYRLYKRFISHDNQHFIEGMKFLNSTTGEGIINFPKIHLANCESKNVNSNGKFKDLVRIFKNMGNKLVEHGIVGENVAPSYYIENLLYNCSSVCFEGSYRECMIKVLQFIFDAIQTGRIVGFICANEQDTLISPKTWNSDNLITYMKCMAEYYLGEINI